MKPELRDEITRTLGTVAEQAGYERGLRAALEAVKYFEGRCNDDDEMGLVEEIELTIERLLEEGRDDE